MPMARSIIPYYHRGRVAADARQEGSWYTNIGKVTDYYNERKALLNVNHKSNSLGRDPFAPRRQWLVTNRVKAAPEDLAVFVRLAMKHRTAHLYLKNSRCWTLPVAT
jgi:hypothetical protein